jgi:hypothetical protein
MAFIPLKNFLSIWHFKLIGLIGPRAVSERVKLDLNIAFEVFMLRLQNHSNYNLYFEYAQRLLNVYSNLLYAHSQ